MPMDIRIKGFVREFIRDRIDYEKKRHGILTGAGGMILREMDAEKFIDDMWVYVNKRMSEVLLGQPAQNGSTQ